MKKVVVNEFVLAWRLIAGDILLTLTLLPLLFIGFINGNDVSVREMIYKFRHDVKVCDKGLFKYLRTAGKCLEIQLIIGK